MVRNQFARRLANFTQTFNILCPSTSGTRTLPAYGIAVSGGVDSMALAFLCSMMRENAAKLQQDSKNANFVPRFRAFVIDHRAREGSGEEAKVVRSQLRTLGIPTTIIKLDWQLKGNQSPASLPNFESLARKLRYHALGTACRCFRIDSLLLAHHKDDQAETVLLRMAGGYTGTGLAGIQQKAGIPECAGMYGVNASGGPPSSQPPSNAGDEGEEMRIATGGVELVRPLMRFSKISLIKLCHENGVPWVEDATNQNVTLTTRNAIRSLLRNKRLPQALNKPALLKLAQAKEEYVETTKGLADDALKQVNAAVNHRAGTLKFEVSKPISVMLNQAAALGFLKRLASWVSPSDDISKAQLVSTCEQVFPDILAARGTLQGPTGPGKRTFTAADVLWEGKTMKDDHTKWIWHLSRQRLAKPVPVCEWSPKPPVNTKVQPYWTWQLFDGRYWVRARHREDQALSLRILREETLKETRKNTILKDRMTALDKLLHQHTPGLLRFTLPAFVDKDTGQVLALPTLGWRADHDDGLEWEIQYKQVV